MAATLTRLTGPTRRTPHAIDHHRVDTTGKSCVVSEEDVAVNPIGPGFAMAIPHATTQAPPPARPVGNAELIDQVLPRPRPLDRRRLRTRTPRPRCTTPTPLDLETIISGSVDLIPMTAPTTSRRATWW